MIFSTIVAGIFLVRLFYLQIIEHNKYVSMADAEQVKSLVIPATRGEIYALDGTTPVKMVLNQTVYTVFVDPLEVKNADNVVSELKKVAGGNLVQDDIESLVKAKPRQYVVVARGLSRQQAEMLKNDQLAGVGFQKMTERVYPEGSLASQVLGFVNAEGKGQYGVEEKLNDQLSGTDGLLRSVTDVANVPLTIGNDYVNKPAVNGQNIVLTIDRNIQSQSEQALADGVKRIGASKGSVIVMDPQTGKVLAMANVPTYDPSKFQNVTDASAFSNATVSAPYEPASVMKSYSMAIGLDKGAIDLNSTFNNTNSISIDGVPTRNAENWPTGPTSMQKIMDWSLNTGTTTVFQRLGQDTSTIDKTARTTVYDYLYNRFHLGQTTGIQLAGEAPGLIISPTEVEGNAVRYGDMSYGQGMDLTMVGVAAGFSSLVNGGNYYKPTVVAGNVDVNGNYHQAAQQAALNQPIKASTSKDMRTLLATARQHVFPGHDTAGYEVGGKTGTAQTIVDGKYVSNQTTASYIGYGGDSQARYVIMVQVSGPGQNLQGNIDAEPIFKDISNWMINYMELRPNS